MLQSNDMIALSQDMYTAGIIMLLIHHMQAVCDTHFILNMQEKHCLPLTLCHNSQCVAVDDDKILLEFFLRLIFCF